MDETIVIKIDGDLSPIQQKLRELESQTGQTIGGSEHSNISPSFESTKSAAARDTGPAGARTPRSARIGNYDVDFTNGTGILPDDTNNAAGKSTPFFRRNIGRGSAWRMGGAGVALGSIGKGISTGFESYNRQMEAGRLGVGRRGGPDPWTVAADVGGSIVESVPFLGGLGMSIGGGIADIFGSGPAAIAKVQSQQKWEAQKTEMRKSLGDQQLQNINAARTATLEMRGMPGSAAIENIISGAKSQYSDFMGMPPEIRKSMGKGVISGINQRALAQSAQVYYSQFGMESGNLGNMAASRGGDSSRMIELLSELVNASKEGRVPVTPR